uniref:Uncharacterized protein n=1 Tax=Kalanchoe fedtschenkoi TaxID=63787 RepID=A0A7N0VIM8_KALFE
MAFSSFAVAPRYHLLNPNSPLPSPNPNFYIRLQPTSSLTYHFKINTINPRTLCNTKTHKTRALSLSDQQPLPSSSATTPKMILVCSAVTILLAVANRVLYKLALVPLKQYPFFLAQFSTFGYVAVYFSILYFRYRAGIVTDEMLALPKSSFAAIGLLEALGVAAGMASAAMLPGPTIPILNQTFLVWQLIFSVFILGRKYALNQIIGCLFVAAGVVIAVTGGSNTGQMLYKVDFVWPALMVLSSAVQACASIVKEFIFIDGARRINGKSVDIFVVNSFGSGFQAIFVLLFLPFLSNLKGIPFAELPAYMRSGVACFLNMGSIQGCDGAPVLPMLYILTNMAFNISLLNLVKISSAVIASLAMTLSVPISIYILSLPLPYLPGGSCLSSFFLMGTAVLITGLFLYNLPQLIKLDSRAD